MAKKDIDLTSNKQLPPGIDPEMSRRLEAKAVGPELTPPVKPKREDPSGLRVPPKASDPEVMQDVMPMKPGHVVLGNADSPPLTPAERKALHEAGWQPGQKIPENVADLVTAVQQKMADDELAGGLEMEKSGRKLVVDTAQIEQLDPSQAAEVRQKMEETANVHRQNAPQPPQPPVTGPDLSEVLSKPAAAQRRSQPVEPVDIHSQAVPGFQPHPEYQPQIPNPKAYPTAAGQPAAPGPTSSGSTSEGEGQVAIDVPPKQESARPMAQPQKKEETPEEPDADTFAGPTQTTCPHCEMPLDLPTLAEPDASEKRAFIQSVLGQKPFEKQYDLLGGAVTIRFRTLTTKEVDTIYKQVYQDQTAGKFLTTIDRNEFVNRYRLYLQLTRLEGQGGLLHDLPDGLNEETNPNASSYWRMEGLALNQTALPGIEEYINSHVLVTENLTRMVTNCCEQFNKLVAKLESVIGNSDFWNLTEEPL